MNWKSTLVLAVVVFIAWKLWNKPNGVKVRSAAREYFHADGSPVIAGQGRL
jgi:predicted negative regulator of RcsB-dependent stress response